MKGKGLDAGTGIMTKKGQIDPKQLGNFKVNRDDMMNARFTERLKTGEFDKVTKGEVAKNLKLSEQYKYDDKATLRVE